MANVTYVATFACPSYKTGLTGTVAYTVYTSSDTTQIAQTTTGVSEPVSGSGCYKVTLSLPAGFVGYIAWTTGDASPLFDLQPINAADTIVVDSNGLVSLSPTGLPQAQSTVANTATPTTSSFNGGSGLSSVDHTYEGLAVAPSSGVNQGIGRICATYVGATRSFTFANPWATACAQGDTFDILGAK